MIYKKLKYEILNILDHYDDPVVIVNGDKINSINGRAKELFKIDNLDDYIGKNISILKSPHEKYESYFTVINESEEEFLDGDKTLRFKFKHVDSQNNDIDTEVLMFKIYDGYDKYLYGILIYDLRHLILDKEEFDNNAQILKSLVDEDAIILIIDSDSRSIVDCSKRACDFYGYDIDSMKNLNIRDLNTLSNKEIKLEVEKAKKDKRNHFIFRHKLSDGKIKLVRVISGPIYYSGKDCLYSVVSPMNEHKKNLDLEILNYEDLYVFAFDKLPFPALIMDMNFNIVKINSKFSLVFKYNEAELLGHTVIDNIIPSDFVEETHVFQSIINNGDLVEKEVFRKDKFGNIKSYYLNAYPIKKDGQILGSVAVYNENTELKQLKHRVNLIEKINENLNEGMIITNHKGEIKWLNKSYAEITGYSFSELINKNPRIFKSGKHDSSFYKNMWDDIEKYGSWRGEITNVKKDGSEYIQWETIIKVINEFDATINYIGVISDISGFKAQEEKIKNLAYRDTLTDLYNRAFFMENADYIINESLAKEKLCAVLYMDLDKFKDINDRYGHEVGDNVLRYVATSIKSVLKSSDIVARIGGDEFAVVLPHLYEIGQLESIVNRIIKTVREGVIISDIIISINISIGVAIAPKHGERLSSLLKNADFALYKAKDIKGGAYKIYSDKFKKVN